MRGRDCHSTAAELTGSLRLDAESSPTLRGSQPKALKVGKRMDLQAV
jgi:hypothetical protein